MNRIGTVMVLAFAVVAMLPVMACRAEDGVMLHLRLDGKDRKIVDARGKAVGLHFISSTADQDDPESTDPSRWRVKGLQGGALRYFAEDRSYSRIDDWPLPDKPIDRLALSLKVKLEDVAKNRFAVFVSTKTNSDKSGFALYLWGHQLRFRFGDGKAAYEVKAGAGKLKDGKWHAVEVAFDTGTVQVWVDGRRTVSKKTDAEVIGPPKRKLFLGGYPISGRGRRMYAFDGRLDEVVLGRDIKSVRQYLDTGKQGGLPKVPPIEYSVQPVDGNERFFGGRRVFHTFRGHPVPMTFLFKGDAVALPEGKPSLVVYVPEGVTVAGVHQSNHNEPGGVIETDTDVVKMDGRTWTRYRTRGVDLSAGLDQWKRGPFATWGFEARPGIDEAKIRYGLVVGGKQEELTETTVRFLDAPEAVGKPGRFHVFGYFIMPAWAWPDKALQEASAELLWSVGLTGKGRFYGHDDYRSTYDEFLKKRGFTLYEIALWHGPKPHAMALDPEGTTREYVERVVGHLKPNGQNEGVMFDYEPWRLAYKPSSFKPEILEAFGRWAGLEQAPTKKQIYGTLRRKWIDYWLHVSAEVYAAMSKAVRTHHPDADALRIAYTYYFPYDDEKALYRRFWSVAKDPRKVEPYVDVHLVSLYHVNGREMVDQTRLSRRHLEKPIWGISSLSRVNPLQSNFTNVEESLSPARLEQKIVLGAALGMQRHGIWPGRGWIDGRHLEAIGRASRFVWEHEPYYFDGTVADGRVEVKPVDNLTRTDWARTVHLAGGRLLVTVFNFSDKPASFNLVAGEAPQRVSVEPHGYRALVLAP